MRKKSIKSLYESIFREANFPWGKFPPADRDRSFGSAKQIPSTPGTTSADYGASATGRVSPQLKKATEGWLRQIDDFEAGLKSGMGQPDELANIVHVTWDELVKAAQGMEDLPDPYYDVHSTLEKLLEDEDDYRQDGDFHSWKNEALKVMREISPVLDQIEDMMK